jgi:diguanylate cyclase (GGDEF)-like protein
LEAWGYEVVVAGDGVEAWRILQGEDAPRLIILDWMMPGLDGVDVCRLVRGRESIHSRSYILLLTVMDGTDELVAGLEAGADDFVAKPCRPEELRARLAVGRRSIEFNVRLAEAFHALDVQARTDDLTGVLNRRAIYQGLEAEFARAARDDAPFCIGMIDVDRFKSTNDTFGHAAGNTVLVEVARSIIAELRPYDVIGRVGGDEFLVVMPRTQGPAALAALARIRAAATTTTVRADDKDVPHTVSIGGAVSCDESVDDLVGRADEALYEAKKAGRDRVVMAPSAGQCVQAGTGPGCGG